MAEAVLEKREGAVSRLLELARSRAGIGPSWLRELRNEGLISFERQGFPTRKNEAWKYTDIGPIAAVEFQPAPDLPEADAAGRLAELPFADLGGMRMVFVNGRFAPHLSRLGDLPQGLQVHSLAALMEEPDETIKAHLAKYAGFEGNPFAALNTAMFEDGAFIHLDRDAIIESPIQVVFLNSAQSEPGLIHPRVLVHAEDNSEVRIVETHLGSSPEQYLVNGVTELRAEKNAVIDYCKLQLESDEAFHLGTVQADQGRDASVRTTLLTLSGRLVRNETNARLGGEGAWAELDGLYLRGKDHHVDNFTQIRHASPHCNSRELYKGILSEKATGVFRGRIVVDKGAQKTDSKQTNNNLLLSNDALINTKPQLEIYADDVKCTHGATIGQLDREAIFYLRSRGISESTARSMLIYAFASELVQRIKAPELRERVDAYLFNWLPMGEKVREAF